KISQLVNKRTDVEELIKDAIPLIPGAFNMSDCISIRITYSNRVYESEGFRESQWVLSESLSKNYQTGDIIEIYLGLDNHVESFPFSIEDINTFSAVSQQLSLALQRFTFEAELNDQLELRGMLNRILQLLLKYSDEKISILFHDLLKQIGSYFGSDFCQILLWDKENRIKSCTRTSWTPEDKLLSVPPDESIFKDLMKIKETEYLVSSDEGSAVGLSLEMETFLVSVKDYSFLIIPIINRERQLGILWITMDRYSLDSRKEVSIFNVIGDIITMAIVKSIRERKIRIYRQAIEQNPATIVITDPDGNINYVNPMFTKTSGYTFDEAIGQNPRILKSGHQDSHFYAELWSTLTKGELWKGTFHNKCKDGHFIWELAVISPIKDSNGKVTGYIAIKEDISDKVEAEEHLKNLNSELIQTQASLVQEEKLASIGRLAAGVAHELNNPIGFVYSNFRTLNKYRKKMQSMIDTLSANNELDQEYIKSLLSDNKIDFIMEDMDELLKESYDGFDRVINIVNSLRSFSRVDQIEPVVIYDLNEAIKTTLIIARNEIKYIAETKTDFGDIPKIKCNSSEINQVILNLIVNAVQAIKSEGEGPKGTIFINTYRENDYICCDVRDTGPGIPVDVIDKIFEPFFTTKPVGEGTGLGLHISYDIIVKKHNGVIYAKNSKNGGAVIKFMLPIIKE
ncbi:MAG: PAS domain S-box protein, partial [Spirochaetales bacterium]|nr:PAS domain S-box protein [Spirochaetales bacterium]